MTIPHPIEIELKLDLPVHQVARFQKLMARRRSEPLQQDLVTRYFDTPDFALSARGVALRVRRIGRRWVQTLKTKGERGGGLSQRVKYEMSIRRGAPDWTRFPAEALEWIPEALRDQLVPVFETRFNRTAWLLKGLGGAQIEVALDVGEVRTLKGINAGQRREPICEIELELKAGRPDALFALAQGWASQLDCIPLDISKAERGVRLAHGQVASPVKSGPVALNDSMRVEDAFAAICQSCIEQFQANLPGVLASDEIEYVHQARVALRRLRAALRLFRRECDVPEALMNDLRALLSALGPARDWDMLCCEILPSIASQYADAEAWQTGFAALQAHRVEVRQAMQAAISPMHPGAWLLVFQRWLLQRGWRSATEDARITQLSPLKKWASQALKKGHRPIVRRAREFGQLNAAQRHALRIAIKRQRYAIEFFQPLFSGRRQVRYQAALQSIQDNLGHSNDVQVAQKLMTITQNRTGPMGQFVLGWLTGSQVEGPSFETARQLKHFMKLPSCW